MLRTPLGSDDIILWKNFKHTDGTKFKLSMMFNNKGLVRDAIKQYAMDHEKNVVIKENDAKRIVVKCMNVKLSIIDDYCGS